MFNTDSDRKTDFVNIIIFLLFLSMGLMLIIRCMYSFNQSDEPFYLSTVHRLWLGDKLVTDEWHPTQFYTPILFPFYAIYRFLVPSGRGVILYFRVITVCFTMFVGLYCSLVIRRLYNIGAVFVAVAAVLIYCGRGNIIGPSYYTLSIDFLLLALLLRSDAVTLKKDNLFLLSGMASSLAVLCVPYLAVGVLIYVPAAFIANSKSKENEGHSFLGKQRRLLLYLMGIAVSAAVYLICFFRILHIGEVLANFVYIFRDPEHTGGYFTLLGQTIGSYRYFTGKLPFYIVPAVSAAVLLYCLFAKGAFEKIILKAVIIFSMTGFWMLMLNKSLNTNGRSAAALSTWCLPVMVTVLYRRYIKRDRKSDDGGFLLSLILGGAALALAFGGASDTGLGGLTTGFVITAVAACICLGEYLDYFYDDKIDSRLIKGAVEGCLLSMMVVMAMTRFFGVYRDADIVKLDTRINEGPAAGLYTEKEVALQYDRTLSMIRDIEENAEGESIFHTAIMPWAYLCTDKKCGAPTTWRTTLDSPILEDYYLLHPDRIPDIVVIYRPEAGSYSNCFYAVKGADHSPNKNATQGALWDYIQRNGYQHYETDVATVYYHPGH